MDLISAVFVADLIVLLPSPLTRYLCTNYCNNLFQATRMILIGLFHFDRTYCDSSRSSSGHLGSIISCPRKPLLLLFCYGFEKFYCCGLDFYGAFSDLGASVTYRLSQYAEIRNRSIRIRISNNWEYD